MTRPFISRRGLLIGLFTIAVVVAGTVESQTLAGITSHVKSVFDSENENSTATPLNHSRFRPSD